MGFSGNKEKVLLQHISDVSKFKNRPLDFYKFEENKIKREHVWTKRGGDNDLLSERRFDHVDCTRGE